MSAARRRQAATVSVQQRDALMNKLRSGRIVNVCSGQPKRAIDALRVAVSTLSDGESRGDTQKDNGNDDQPSVQTASHAQLLQFAERS
jgi:hypothetical protein